MRSRLILLISVLIAACSDGVPEPTNETANVGFVRVTAPTLGLGLDTNGYTVTLDPGSPTALTQDLPVNGRADFGGVPNGDHTFVIEDVSANCALGNDASQPVTVLGGRIQPLTYPVTCTAPRLTGPNLIAFQSDRDGIPEIYTMQPDGSQQTRVTHDQVGNVTPSFAPDGQTIAFEQLGDTARDIFVVGADGSGETNLTETGSETFETGPSYSPDASRIAFLSDPNGAGGLAVMNGDTAGSDVRIVFRGSLHGRPAWSPDGYSLAFETDSGIVRTDANGGNPAPIFIGDAHNPDWSPDGLRIAFDTQTLGDAAGIFVIGIDGTNLVRVSTGEDHTPTWSPDGSQIAFTRGIPDGGDEDIFVVNADGSALTQLTTATGGDSHPSWSH